MCGGSVADLTSVSAGRCPGAGDGRYVDETSVTVGPKASFGAIDGVEGDLGDCTVSGVSIDAYKGAMDCRRRTR